MNFLFRVPVAAVIFKRWIVVDVLWFEKRSYYLFLIKIQQVNCTTRGYTAGTILFLTRIKLCDRSTHCTGKIHLNGGLPSDSHLALEKADRGYGFRHFYLYTDGIPRVDASFEFGTVDAG